MFRGLAVGIYTTNSPEACHYVAENSEANIIVVENKHQLHKILKVSAALYIVRSLQLGLRSILLLGKICVSTCISHQVMLIKRLTVNNVLMVIFKVTTNIYINGNILTNIKECDQMSEGWM